MQNVQIVIVITFPLHSSLNLISLVFVWQLSVTVLTNQKELRTLPIIFHDNEYNGF